MFNGNAEKIFKEDILNQAATELPRNITEECTINLSGRFSGIAEGKNFINSFCKKFSKKKMSTDSTKKLQKKFRKALMKKFRRDLQKNARKIPNKVFKVLKFPYEYR